VGSIQSIEYIQDSSTLVSYLTVQTLEYVAAASATMASYQDTSIYAAVFALVFSLDSYSWLDRRVSKTVTICFAMQLESPENTPG
jgi:hypothetical protein